jgi:molybdopterin synthase catalytic subunit
MSTWITQSEIDVTVVLSHVRDAADGAVLLFLGTVRDHNDGRRVSGMRYDAYVEMAERVLADLAREAAERLGTHRIAAVHRIGELSIGDISVAVAVSAPHRDSAYAASRYLIEELKARLPVWKHEHYVDGPSQWLEGTIPRADA